jgi:1-acyl-sn-glycerol-3-phosphate acyltransferase
MWPVCDKYYFIFNNRKETLVREFVKFCLRVVLKLMKAKCQFDFDINQLPKKGVYVANHVSYLDPILLFAFLPGNPVFALNGHLYRRHWISFLMQRADIIQFNPIEPGDIKKLIAKVDGTTSCYFCRRAYYRKRRINEDL